jgi:Putative zinc-finger
VVADFAAGRLLAADADRVELHVDGCAECRALVAAAARGR